VEPIAEYRQRLLQTPKAMSYLQALASTQNKAEEKALKGEEKKDEKGEDKGEKKADGESTEALDLLVETRASELAEGWLRENGYIQGAGE